MQPLTAEELRFGYIFVACLMAFPVIFGTYIAIKLIRYIHKYNQPGDLFK